MLTLRSVHALQGRSPVLRGVSLQVAPGEIVALLGRNGSGRSTTAQAVMGLVQTRGEILLGDVSLAGLAPFEVARRGVGYVPETRDVFPGLSVQENLEMGVKPGARRGPGTWRLDEVYALFPPLAERRRVPAGVLSGGEQQMLALCRALMGDPSILLVDEPTEGLAPQVVEQVARCLQALAARGIGVLLIEQKLAIAMDIARRCLVMGQGRIVFEGRPADLRGDAAVRREWLEV